MWGRLSPQLSARCDPTLSHPGVSERVPPWVTWSPLRRRGLCAALVCQPPPHTREGEGLPAVTERAQQGRPGEPSPGRVPGRGLAGTGSRPRSTWAPAPWSSPASEPSTPGCERGSPVPPSSPLTGHHGHRDLRWRHAAVLIPWATEPSARLTLSATASIWGAGVAK